MMSIGGFFLEFMSRPSQSVISWHFLVAIGRPNNNDDGNNSTQITTTARIRESDRSNDFLLVITYFFMYLFVCFSVDFGVMVALKK